MLTVDPWYVLLNGLIVGLIFGFLLNKSGVSKYRVILGQLLMADFTMLRVMLTAMVVGSLGVLAMHQLWDVNLHLKPAIIWANVLGGAIFGVGMALLGYCPGTGVAAAGEGSRHAAWGVGGMLVGAALYAEVDGWFKRGPVFSWDLGKETFSSLSGISPWVYLLILAGAALVAFGLLSGRDTVEHPGQ